MGLLDNLWDKLREKLGLKKKPVKAPPAVNPPSTTPPVSTPNPPAAEWPKPAPQSIPSPPPQQQPGTLIDTPPGLVSLGFTARDISRSKDIVWKPKSQDTNDNREGKPAVVTTQKVPAMPMLRIFSSNGNEIGKLTYYGSYGSHGARWYTGHRGGSNDTPDSLLSKARAQGNGMIYVEWHGGAVLGPIVPTARVGDV